MKSLVAIPACHSSKDLDLQRACLDTWIGKWGHLVEVKFFLGEPTFSSTPNNISLNVPDGYRELPVKVRAMFQWILDNGYDRVFKVDTDTYVHVPRLLACGKDEFDYVGRLDQADRYNHWMQGGAGYWLSRRALELLVNLPLSVWERDWREDRIVGFAMFKSGMKISSDSKRLFDSNYPQYPSTPLPTNETITAHKCDVARHHAIHQAFASI